MTLITDLLVNLLAADPQVVIVSKILGITLIVFTIFAIIKIFSNYYLLSQYRLIQVYFDQEKVDNWLKKHETSS